jgi:CubicO group peptidase (beta-lactamase class C family)
LAARYQAQGLGPAAGYGWYTADKAEPICDSMEKLGTLPFVAQPGEAFVYGYNTDVLGCVIERVSGMSLEAFLRKRITLPLRMRDTHFFLPPDQRARLTAVYASDESGGYARAEEGARGQGHYVDGPRRSFAGGAGLVSTARDYARFLQMLLNGGTLDGVRLLSPKTVDVMTSNQVGSLFATAGREPGLGFGLGFQTNDALGADGLASLGTYGWGGAYGSVYKVDPKERVVIVFMIQLLPNRTDIRDKFPTMVFGALGRGGEF